MEKSNKPNSFYIKKARLASNIFYYLGAIKISEVDNSSVNYIAVLNLRKWHPISILLIVFATILSILLSITDSLKESYIFFYKENLDEIHIRKTKHKFFK